MSYDLIYNYPRALAYPYQPRRQVPYVYPPRRPAYRRCAGYGAFPPLAMYQWTYEEELRIQELTRFNREWQKRQRERRYHTHTQDLVDAKNSPVGIYEPSHAESMNYQPNRAFSMEQAKQIEIVDLTADEAGTSSVQTSNAGVDILALACAEIGDFTEEITCHQQADTAPLADMVSEYLEDIEYGRIECSQYSGKTVEATPVDAEIGGEDYLKKELEKFDRILRCYQNGEV